MKTHMKKQRITVTLDETLIRKARLAVKNELTPSLVGLFDAGLRKMVRLIEQRHRLTARRVRLRAGRKKEN